MRVHSNTRHVTDSNPGIGKPTRFAFFGSPSIPVLYAAETEEAAVAESLLHDVPLSGRPLPARDYRDHVLGRFEVLRDLRLAMLHGLGLRRLNITNTDVIDVHGAGVYRETVAWAAAAHSAGSDGVEWMSTKCNNSPAQVLFGDRVLATDLLLDPAYGRVFLLPEHFNWLVDMCVPLRIEVLPPH
ncbi:MAG TPA: RES domain-containing protein [Nocardioidaceae bacterium]|nr:RES domain-containing protein [Nocardioidaceae bacterium]